MMLLVVMMQGSPKVTDTQPSKEPIPAVGQLGALYTESLCCCCCCSSSAPLGVLCVHNSLLCSKLKAMVTVASMHQPMRQPRCPAWPGLSDMKNMAAGHSL